ncbi:hypothetical protein BSKO_13794 [Bryopsis sp. KO-2023]|nr:hypothetical protein BSKO_13794 [Bryopsis sp. KO-2023]
MESKTSDVFDGGRWKGTKGESKWSALREPRYRIVAACFLATFCAYVERVGFSIAFTAMAKEGGLDEGVKGTVLSAFYWGYGVSQVPGGAFAQRFGGRPLLLISFALWSTAALLTPSDPKQTGAVALARVCVGVAQGFIIPSVHTVLSQWIPPTERAKATSLTTSGMYLGSAAAMYALPSVVSNFGPGALLRVVGGMGLVWCALWYFVGKEAPVSENEVPINRPQRSTKSGTPWLALMTSIPVWSIIINNFTFHYSVYVVMNWLPTYFNSLLNADLAQLGSVKTMPYIIMFLSSNAGGWLGDWFILRLRRSVAQGRKLVNTLGFWGAAVSLMLMPLATNVTTGVLCTSLAMGFLGLSRGGFSVNHMDIAPKFAGVVMGISNTAGTLSGVIGVAVTGFILEHHGGSTSVAGWQSSFATCAVLGASGSLLFIFFAKGEKLFD